MSEEQAIKVLIVDDDRTFAESNQDLLEAFGYDVRTAANGAEGLAVAHEWRPDVMLLDVMMTHDTEGFEVARKIPESPELRGMAVLLVTGMTRELRLPEPIRADQTWLPVDRVLEKPIPPERLMKEIENALERKREEQE
jgi:two-component system alkaline phosphatase synthesis response regulator PhoP